VLSALASLYIFNNTVIIINARIRIYIYFFFKFILSGATKFNQDIQDWTLFSILYMDKMFKNAIAFAVSFHEEHIPNAKMNILPSSFVPFVPNTI
jgi:hypothetical protein